MNTMGQHSVIFPSPLVARQIEKSLRVDYEVWPQSLAGATFSPRDKEHSALIRQNKSLLCFTNSLPAKRLPSGCFQPSIFIGNGCGLRIHGTIQASGIKLVSNALVVGVMPCLNSLENRPSPPTRPSDCRPTGPTRDRARASPVGRATIETGGDSHHAAQTSDHRTCAGDSDDGDVQRVPAPNVYLKRRSRSHVRQPTSTPARVRRPLQKRTRLCQPITG
jgi:hypothetical protein